MGMVSIVNKAAASGTKSATTGTTFTISLNPAAGTYFVVVSVSVASATVTVSNVQDTTGNSYSRLGSKTNGALIQELWGTGVSAASPGGTITITLSATGTEAAGVAVAYTGVLSVGATTGVTGAGSPADSGTIALGQRDNSCLLFGVCVANGVTLVRQNGMIVISTGSPDFASTNALIQHMTAGGGSASVDASATYTSGAWAGVYLELDGVLPAQGGGRLLWGYDGTTDNLATGTSVSVQAGPANNVPQGSLIVAIWRTTQKGTGGQVTISDNFNAGNYTQAVLSDEAGGSTGEIACYYMANSLAIAAGQLIVSASTPVSNGLLYLGVLVYSGVGLFDGANSFSYGVTTTSSPNSGNATPSVTGGIAIGGLALPSNTQGGGATVISTESSGFTAELDDHMGVSGPAGNNTPIYAHAHGADQAITTLSALAYNPTISATIGGANIFIVLFAPLILGDTVTLTGKWQLQ